MIDLMFNMTVDQRRTRYQARLKDGGFEVS
jgi:hypothetical protein